MAKRSIPATPDSNTPDRNSTPLVICIRMSVVDDYERRRVFPGVIETRARMIEKDAGSTGERIRQFDLVVTRKDAYALYEDALEQRTTKPAGNNWQLSWSYNRLMRSIALMIGVPEGDAYRACRPVHKRDWRKAGGAVQVLFCDLQIPWNQELA